MVSSSYGNLLELASGEAAPSVGQLGRRIPRVVTEPRMLPEIDAGVGFAEAYDGGDVDGEEASPHGERCARTIIVANELPIRAARREGGGGWKLALDEDSLLLQLRDALRAAANYAEMEFVYVGWLRDEVPPAEHDAVAQAMFEEFKCVPVFLPGDLRSRFYHGFCKQQLWPLFHYMLPMSPELGGRFDRSLWQAYVSANKLFADRILEVINPDDDFVWVHDYHLMVLPTFLRKRFNRIKLGFFLHSPFPSSEIYRTLPVREELLRSLLNADLVGFHTFDYARHFLTCCGRILGLSYESKRGYIGIDYIGRTVNIKILPVGIHLGQLRSVLHLPETEKKAAELAAEFNGRRRVMLLGVDDMDIFKGISLKLLAFEQLLLQRPKWRGRAVLVQIANPARGRGKDVVEVRNESYAAVRRINDAFGRHDYQPVVLIDRPLRLSERMAHYTAAECCLVTAVRDGMNLIPYEYVIARQISGRKTSTLVVSEFIGCSPSLSGAIRVNPWNIDAVADAMGVALEMNDAEKQLRHEKHYKYVSTHDVGYWANSFLQDLERACKDHGRRRSWGLGFGLRFRVLALDSNFKKLSIESIVAAYRRATTRAILLDYDGTLMPQPAIDKRPSGTSIEMLNALCMDAKNTVFLVSAKSRRNVTDWFAPCDNLGLAAEHGYFIRLRRDSEWETTCSPATDCGSGSPGWKQIAEPVMRLYTETTDGSTIEEKETSLVWSYEDADRDFGSCQAKELLDHLESVLANEPVTVKASLHNVEVKPQGVSKGLVAKRLLATMNDAGLRPDFVLCIGDDRSDEDMFGAITGGGAALAENAEVFACTVGQRPSKAKYYLEDRADIHKLVQALANASGQPRRTLLPPPSTDDIFHDALRR